MGHGCWRGGGRRRWRNKGSVAVGTPLTGVRHSRETGGTANVPRYRARGGHRILYRERPAAGPTETGIRRLCPAEWTRLRAVGNRGRCKHVLERALDEPAALSYVRSARLVNSNLHGARYRAAGARPGRSPAGWARLSPPARSRAGGAHLPTLSGLRSMESQNRGSSALASEPPRPTAPIRTHGDVARRYSARGSTRMGAVWFFGSVVPRRSESPRNKSCAVACVRSVASHQLLNGSRVCPYTQRTVRAQRVCTRDPRCSAEPLTPCCGTPHCRVPRPRLLTRWPGTVGEVSECGSVRTTVRKYWYLDAAYRLRVSKGPPVPICTHARRPGGQR